ncbi:MAG: hypothetical protein G01um101448_629 [Parcubacteria group bacterium Gr01-1014_48]|nr:MAG: hypothetical protein Greene041614_981 [Parcubacteria group bacterium Greene0416_14]TSC73682.1 MAG: hypothetical protein G01um101448_629 [Parcubacteria group bacterium Gr01-1014_48]TSD00262.1 MAG: hypothetical protein Greene101415_921 [Parcubacteria group bacterium Greene1014_15]
MQNSKLMGENSKQAFRTNPRSNASTKCPKFVAKIAYFEEVYRDTLTKKTRFAAEFWAFRQTSFILLHILRLDRGLVLIASQQRL